MQTGAHLIFAMLLSGTDGSIPSTDRTFLIVITEVLMAILHRHTHPLVLK